MAALQALQVDTLSVLLVPAVVLLGVLVSQKNRAPDVHPALLRQQSEISRTRNSAESAVLRNRQTPHGRPLTSSYDKSLKTTYDAFWNIVKTQPQRDLLGYKVGNAYAWLSAEVLGKRVENLGAGLLQSTGVQSLQHDVDPESKNMVGILLSNSAEWAIADYACVTYSLVSVPIPTKAETAIISHILSYTALSAIITSTAFAEKLFDNKNAYSNLKYIVLADVTDIPEQLLQRAQALNLSLLTLKEVESAGQANPKPHVPPQPDDIFTISFSTDPKSNGAMIPHSGVASAGAGILSMLPPSIQIASEDRHLSHLPLSSMYERSVVHAAVSAGCQVAFYDGTNVLHELKVADPTVIFTSAEILSKLASKIKVDYAINPPVEKLFHSIAFALKSWALSGGRVSRSGKVKFVMADGSSSSDALTYARTALGCQVYQSYGKPASSGVGLSTSFGDYTFPFGEHIGVPLPSVEVKLVDVPQYTASDKPNPRGELCIRGPVMLKGYYKAPKATAEAVDASGWLHTGDVVEFLPNGTVKVLHPLV